MFRIRQIPFNVFIKANLILVRTIIRAYGRSCIASLRLTTTDIGLSLRLAYDCVMHTAPGQQMN